MPAVARMMSRVARSRAVAAIPSKAFMIRGAARPMPEAAGG